MGRAGKMSAQLTLYRQRVLTPQTSQNTEVAASGSLNGRSAVEGFSQAQPCVAPVKAHTVLPTGGRNIQLNQLQTTSKKERRSPCGLFLSCQRSGQVVDAVGKARPSAHGG